MKRGNYDVLYSALKLFRDAMLPFLIEKLKAAYGNAWWHDGIKRVVGERAVSEMESAYERRYGKAMSPLTRGYVELYEMLDINRFLPLVEGNWRAYSETLRELDVAKVWLREINTVRNAVSHPESGDLPDSDAVRAIDTMSRLLRLINPEAAEQMEELRKELQSASRGHLYPLREGALDYELAFLTIERTVAAREGEESPIIEELEEIRRSLSIITGEHDLAPGADVPDPEEQRNALLARADEIAKRVMRRSFADLAVVAPLPITPEDTHAQIAALEVEITAIGHELEKQERKLEIQRQTGPVLPPLTRAMARNKKLLDRYKAEREHISATAAPPAFFRLRRVLDPLPSDSYVQEQSFDVITSITNLGSNVVAVRYADALTGPLARISGSDLIEGVAGPGMTLVMRYTCRGTVAGDCRISTASFGYDGRSAIWDELPETRFSVRRGSDPHLEITRYYEHAPNALRVLISIENQGERSAHDVRFRDVMRIDGKEAPKIIAYGGTLAGHEKTTIEEKPIEDVLDVDRIHFAPSTIVTYRDSGDTLYEERISDVIQQLDRNINAAQLALIGRDAVLRDLRSELDTFVDAARKREASPQVHVVAIEGLEGMGKSRLVQELSAYAQQLGAMTGNLDIARFNPIRALVGDLFGIADGLDSAALDAVLLERFAGESNAPVRDALRQLVQDFTTVRTPELERLTSNVIAPIRALSRDRAVLLFIENVHIKMEGLEQSVVRQLIEDAVTLTNSFIFVCVTHRPMERGPFALLSRPIPPARRQEIVLEALADADVRELASRLVGFPALEEQLQRTVTAWCKGNPMYVTEAVRVLVKTPSLLVRVGGEWYSDESIDLSSLVSKDLREVVKERIHNELTPELVDFGRRLAAIGFEIPLSLAEAVFAATVPQWSDKLSLLEGAGIIVPLPGASAYQFEHEVKYDVLLESTPLAQRPTLAHDIAEALLHHRDIYPSVDEQLCQFARQAAEASLAYQREHQERLLAAAKIEADRSNFTQSLNLYEKLLDVVPRDSVEAVDMRIERSRVLQKRGNFVAAKAEVDAAADLLKPGTSLGKMTRTVRRLDTVIEKEYGLLALNQQQSAMTPEKHLIRALERMDGLFGFGRIFHPATGAYYRDVVDIHLGLAEAWRRSSVVRKALRACSRAEAAAKAAKKKELDDGSLLSAVYLKRGQLIAQSSGGAIEESQIWYERALREAGDDPYESERILSAWADALGMAKRYADAVEKYERAVDVQKDLGDQQGLVLSFSGLGMLYEDWNEKYDPAKVEYYFEQTIEHSLYLIDPRRLWRACAGLARILLGRREFDKAWTHWLQARAVLIDGDFFSKLSQSRRVLITSMVESFCTYFETQKKAKEFEICATDLSVIYASAMSKDADYAHAMLRRGSALMMTQQWAEAEAAYRTALESVPEVRGEAYARLGDLFALHTPKFNLSEAEADPEKKQDQAELYYTEAVVTYLRRGDDDDAAKVYEKLVRHLTSDESGLLEIPHVLLRILRGVPPDIVIHRRIIEQAVEILVDNQLWADAADVLIYALREWMRRPDTSVSASLQQSYIERADALYHRGNADQLMYGLNMLIPVHFEIGEWTVLVGRFEELFEINMQRLDAEEAVSSLGDLTAFGDRIEIDHLLRFVEIAKSLPDRLRLDDRLHAATMLYIGKMFSKIAQRTGGKELDYAEQGLACYEKALQLAPLGDDDLRGAILNDSAIVLSKAGRYAEALTRLDEAISIKPTATRIHGNRARALSSLGRTKEAVADHQKETELARARHHRWRNRLERRDESPLTADEIMMMAYDTETLASAIEDYGMHLVAEEDDETRGRELIEESSRLYAEIGKESQIALWLRLRDNMVRGGTDIKGVLERLRISPSQIEEIGTTMNEPRLLARDIPCPHCEALIPGDDWVCGECNERICPYCHSAVEHNIEECDHCQVDLCSTCGAALEDDPPTCANCGAPVRWVAGGKSGPRPGSFDS